MNPKSLQNLVSLADLPPERRREIARMGGIASGRKRRRLAHMRKTARILNQIYSQRREQENRQQSRKTRPRKPEVL